MNKNKVLNFPRQSLTASNTINFYSQNYNNNDKINIEDDSIGGGRMNYVTREELNSKLETVNVKIEKLEDKIESSNKNVINEIKLYIEKENKELKKESEELKRWIIGAIIVPILIFIVSLILNSK